MTIIELGAKLREARESRNLTVADVSYALKIPSRILSGIEEGSGNLPRTVYVFHFIKDYARYVGFSAEEATSMASSLEGFDKIAHPVRTAPVQFTPVRPSPVPRVLGAVLKLALFAALGFGGYNAYLHLFAERDAQIVEEQKSVQQSMTGSAETTPWNAPQQKRDAAGPDVAGSAAPGSAAADAPAGAEPAANVAAGGDQAMPQVSQAPAQQAPQDGKIALPTDPAPNWDAPAAAPPQSTFVTAAAAQDPAAPHQAYLLGQEQPAQAAEGAAQDPGALAAQPVPEGMHQVVVLADMGDCWMGFEPDGKKQQRMLRKGDSMTMTFKDALQLRLGNAAAVRISYDGRELDRSAAARPVNLAFPLAQ